MRNKLKMLFEKQGITLSENQLAAFEGYAKQLVEWNEKINLTAITDDDGVCEKHFLDSIIPAVKTEIPNGATLIDVGTGAGFPAIPIKIIRPDVNITLLDSLNKRINFLQSMSDSLSLEADCIHMRAEDGGKNPELREKFDIATARAVASLPVLVEYCLPYVKVGGEFIALKGPNEDVDEAQIAIQKLGGIIESVEDYELPCGDKRRLVVIRKSVSTPKEYPRSAAKIKGAPL